MSTLLVSRMESGEPELFASVQGEGASMGMASTFVRLAVCNLRCSWCDTAYTWDWARFDRAAQVMTLESDAIAALVANLPPRNVVVTGGEPLIQRRQLVPLAEQLGERGFRIEIETNGTIAPAELDGLVDQFNVSPKLRHSGNEGLTRIRDDVLSAFAATSRAYFKFVIAEPNDLSEVAGIMANVAVAPDRIILMPEGRSPAELGARSGWLAEACVARGYRFSTRLHVLLWGDTRGV